MNDYVTVFGGGGFVGRYVVEALLRAGTRVRVAERRPKNAWHLKAQADLGQIQFVAADVTQADSVARAVKGADAVINLVGAFGKQMVAVQQHGAAIVAAAAREAGARALIHVSAIGADRNSPSAYGKSKAAGEEAVREAFPTATILRPSIIFGREDQFVNRFAGLIQMLPVVPVIGGKTRFQPVHVGDVARAVVAVLGGAGVHGGQTYELGGPQILSMRALNQWIADECGHTPFFVDVPDVIAGAAASLTGWLPGAPITRDQWLMLGSDNVVADGAKGLDALGITPMSLAAAAPRWLLLYRRLGRFGATA